MKIIKKNCSAFLRSYFTLFIHLEALVEKKSLFMWRRHQNKEIFIPLICFSTLRIEKGVVLLVTFKICWRMYHWNKLIRKTNIFPIIEVTCRQCKVQVFSHPGPRKKCLIDTGWSKSSVTRCIALLIIAVYNNKSKFL